MDFAPCHLCDRRQRPPVAGKSACLADPERRDITVLRPLGICLHPDGPRFTLTEVTIAGKAASQPCPDAEPFDWSKRGPELWGELHRRPRESDGDDAAWLVRFRRRIPCGTCREHWREWVAANPPPDPLSFEWTWRAHAAVNERLGKPSPTLEEARATWGY